MRNKRGNLAPGGVLGGERAAPCIALLSHRKIPVPAVGIRAPPLPRCSQLIR